MAIASQKEKKEKSVSKRTKSDTKRLFPRDIQKYLIKIRDFFTVHHGIELSDSDCLRVAMHHYCQNPPDIKKMDKINISTDSRTQIGYFISEAHYSKLTNNAKRMGLPTTQLCLMVVMFVSEVFEEGTDYEVSEISDRY